MQPVGTTSVNQGSIHHSLMASTGPALLVMEHFPAVRHGCWEQSARRRNNPAGNYVCPPRRASRAWTTSKEKPTATHTVTDSLFMLFLASSAPLSYTALKPQAPMPEHHSCRFSLFMCCKAANTDRGHLLGPPATGLGVTQLSSMPGRWPLSRAGVSNFH